MIKVYIADDEPWILSLLENVIPWQKLGFVIIGRAGDGESALREIGFLKPRIIITDIRMPEMNGLDLIKAVRKLNFTTDFIVLTGHSEFDYARKALRTGVFDYLLKPIDEDKLKAVLEKLKKKIGEGDRKSIRESEDRKRLETLSRMVAREETQNDIPEDLETNKNRIKKAIFIMKKEFGSDISLADISSRIFLSESYFSDCFSRETGKTFIDYLTDIRIENACRLLKKQGLKIKDVAGLSGYRNPNYFCRVFKKKTGLSPKEYIQKHEKKLSL